MIDLLRDFIRGERTENWTLHLQAMYDMLPYFAASGHNQYPKSVHLYLQKMSQISEKHPDVVAHFMAGLHGCRRSDNLWTGLTVDLVIEQCLMRSVKTTGGLTRGRGMSEIQRLVWVLSTPACVYANSAMQDFTKVHYTKSNQHKDRAPARMARDDI